MRQLNKESVTNFIIGRIIYREAALDIVSSKIVCITLMVILCVAMLVFAILALMTARSEYLKYHVVAWHGHVVSDIIRQGTLVRGEFKLEWKVHETESISFQENSGFCYMLSV